MTAFTEDVARYYDENTRAFLARGQGGREGVLHRAVWGEGVRTRAEAFHFAHQLVLRELESLAVPRPRVLDLGCGVGASLSYIADRHPVEAFGITVSEEGLLCARARDGIRWLSGDFCTEPLPEPLDLAYGIESFVHAENARAFFGNVSSALRQGGKLVLVDDFLAPSADRTGPVSDFIEGWHARSLLRPGEADDIARSYGLALVSDRDLTSALELDRPRDRAIALALSLLRPKAIESSRARSIVGGNALRKCLKQGLVTYRVRVWRKREVS